MALGHHRHATEQRSHPKQIKTKKEEKAGDVVSTKIKKSNLKKREDK